METVFGLLSTAALLLGFLLLAAFLSPRLRHQLARQGSRLSPRLGRLLRDGIGEPRE